MCFIVLFHMRMCRILRQCAEWTGETKGELGMSIRTKLQSILILLFVFIVGLVGLNFFTFNELKGGFACGQRLRLAADARLSALMGGGTARVGR